VEQFRGGLVSRAHRLLYHSTLGSRVIKKKKKYLIVVDGEENVTLVEHAQLTGVLARTPCRSCSVVNFIARKLEIETLSLLQGNILWRSIPSVHASSHDLPVRLRG
jgi:hypothetical protein